MQRLVDFVSMVTQQYVTTQQSFNALPFFLIPFYLQAVQIHLANSVKLLEA
jgi:hypothetical protein